MDIVKLKKITTETQDIIIVAIRISEKQQRDPLIELNNHINSVIINEEFSKYDQTILFIGDLNNYKHYKDVVFKYKKKHFGGNPKYRNYCVTAEQQLKTSLYVNVAEDPETSWNTVKSALGAQNVKDPCYGIIVRFTKEKEIIYDNGGNQTESVNFKDSIETVASSKEYNRNKF